MNTPCFKAISLTHKKAPLAIRELLALDTRACQALLLTLRRELGLSDVLVLSTCNRTEVYYSSPGDFSTAILEQLAALKGRQELGEYGSYFTCFTRSEEAVQHLFEVAMGLDAQVVGDQQISQQVKQAYQWSVDADAAGPFLHRLLHSIFYTHKRVEQETSFREGAASTAYATLELVERLTAHLPSPRVLVLGLGEIGSDACKYFAGSSRFAEVKVCNRTRSRAEAVAAQHGLPVLDFADLALGLQAADVVVSSVAAATPLITGQLMAGLSVLSHKFLVDLSVPRSIEAEVEDVPGVLLYTIDAIRSQTSATLQRRLAAVPQVRAIIAESMAALREWSREMAVSPTIQKLKSTLEQLRQEELQRYQNKVSPAEAARLEEVTKALMQKVLKQPVLQLKAACRRGETGALVDLLTELFDLEKEAAHHLSVA
ncbi:glutamyl-tRNA reductase [Hymenobacter saemangeumensis]|uniref:Glutamyl-tRNA reductase n=1 Tax=Hymenobacter saemangeumensis TaxID=1084522 RepID=A0ABP8IDM9_9BACT